MFLTYFLERGHYPAQGAKGKNQPVMGFASAGLSPESERPAIHTVLWLGVL